MASEEQDAFGGLEAAREQFEASTRDAMELARDLTDAQLNWRPGPGRWSVGECLMHLAVSTDAALPAIDHAIAHAQQRVWPAAGPYRYGWFTRWMVQSMEPPPKRRMRTFSIFTPPSNALVRDEVLRALTQSRDRLLERTRAAAGVDLKRAIVVSPVSRLFRMPLGGYLAFLAAHDRRHLWQARQVRQASGFGQM
jgi:DinB family protein